MPFGVLSGGGGGGSALSAAGIQGVQFGGNSTGAANTYAVTLSPALGSYLDGMVFSFDAHQTNTGNTTINVNGLGSRTLKLQGVAQIYPGAIQSGDTYLCMVDDTAVILLNPHEGIQTWTPTVASFGGAAITNQVTVFSNFWFKGAICHAQFRTTFDFSVGGSGITFTVPVTAQAAAQLFGPAHVFFAANDYVGFYASAGGSSTTTVEVYRASIASGSGTGRSRTVHMSYRWI